MSHAEAVREAFTTAIGRLDMDQVAPAANALAERLRDGGLLYILGCGHSQVLAFEGYYRAGAPAWVAPLLDDRVSPARGAGCTDAELLGHLRSPGPHVRGCWAIDLRTGRERGTT